MKHPMFVAACCIAIAAPSFLQAQPPAPGEVDAPEDQATAQQPAPDAQDDQQQESEAAAPQADVDSAQSDPGAGFHRPEDGLPDWVLGRYCFATHVTVYAADHTITHFHNGRPSGGVGHWRYLGGMHEDQTSTDVVLFWVSDDGPVGPYEEQFQKHANGVITSEGGFERGSDHLTRCFRQDDSERG